MKKFLMISAVAALTACGGTDCEQAADLIEACVEENPNVKIEVEEPAEECDEGTQAQCEAACTIDLEDVVCEIVDGTNKEGATAWLDCLVDCAEAAKATAKK